jgi:4-hydroxy-tetrahydrodipicolinate synthase
MAEARFDGSCVALITPFDANGVHESTLRELVRFHHEEGTDALLVCGSTGEAATMSAHEQRIAAEIVIDENARRLPVVVGCGGSDTAVVATLAEQAADAGADAILVSAPPYNKPPQRGLISHFKAMLDAADLPLIVYNVPGRSAVNILPATIAALAEDERVIGVKEASGDLAQVAELARVAGDRVVIWSGNDENTLPVLSLGGRGVVSVMANVAPRRTSRMVHAYLEGRVDEAKSEQLALLPLIAALFSEPNPIPVKAGVAWLGFETGPLRLPLVEAEPATRQRTARALEELGIRPGAAAARA